jgi:hypothetical protein
MWCARLEVTGWFSGLALLAGKSSKMMSAAFWIAPWIPQSFFLEEEGSWPWGSMALRALVSLKNFIEKSTDLRRRAGKN